FRGLIVEAGRKSPARGKAGDRQAAHRGFGAARHHDIGIAKGEEAARVADCMRAGRAGRYDPVGWAFQPAPDRHLPGCEIDEASWNEERTDAPRATITQRDRRLLDALQPTYSRANQNTGGILILRLFRVPSGVFQRLISRRDRIDDEI